MTASTTLWRRPVVVVPAAAVVIGGAVFLGLRASGSNAANNAAATSTEQLFTVAPTTMQQTVSATGTIAPAATEDLSFTSAGTVTAVNVKAGQKVKKGAVLATIDSAALQSALQQANASYASAQAQLSDDEASGASSEQLSSDEANVAAQKANVASAFSDLLGARLTSPIAGTVATVNLTVGQVLNSSGGSGTDITGTGDGSGRVPSSNGDSSNGSSTAQIEVVSNAFVVNLSVDTATVGKIKAGQGATVTPTTSSGSSGGNGAFPFPGGGGFTVGNFNGSNNANDGSSQTNSNTAVGAAATGTVSSVGAVASSSSGVATFPVVIAVSGTPDAFHAGASASAAIVYSEKANVLAVPVNAVTQSNGESYVTVSANGQKAKRTVTTGITANGQIEITSGVRSGELVVVTLPNFTRSGARNGNGTTGEFPNGARFPTGDFKGFVGNRGG